MSGKVFVVQEPMTRMHGRVRRTYSLAPAEEFGALVFVLDWSETRDLGKGDGAAETEVLWKIRQRLEGYCPDEDYILMTGDWFAMALTVSVALEMTGGRARCLQWDKVDGKYRVLVIDINAPPPQGGGELAK